MGAKGSEDSNEIFRVNGVNETTGNLAVGKAGMHNLYKHNANTKETFTL
jgi:hypothetical protein